MFRVVAVKLYSHKLSMRWPGQAKETTRAARRPRRRRRQQCGMARGTSSSSSYSLARLMMTVWLDGNYFKLISKNVNVIHNNNGIEMLCSPEFSPLLFSFTARKVVKFRLVEYSIGNSLLFWPQRHSILAGWFLDWSRALSQNYTDKPGNVR